MGEKYPLGFCQFYKSVKAVWTIGVKCAMSPCVLYRECASDTERLCPGKKLRGLTEYVLHKVLGG